MEDEIERLYRSNFGLCKRFVRGPLKNAHTRNPGVPGLLYKGVREISMGLTCCYCTPITLKLGVVNERCAGSKPGGLFRVFCGIPQISLRHCLANCSRISKNKVLKNDLHKGCNKSTF